MSKSRKRTKFPSSSVVNQNAVEPSDKIEQIKTIIDQSSDQERNVIFETLSVSYSSQHSGPLPAPETLAKYNEIIKNGAERIMSMAEKQSNHREGLENRVIQGQLSQSGLGQKFGFAIAIIALGIAWHLATLGHDLVASVIGGGTVLGLVSVFVIGKRRQSRDSEEE